MVVVLRDDTGFAQFGCYGSDIDTPNIDVLAANGLQFTNFHVTPVCSPTRAAHCANPDLLPEFEHWTRVGGAVRRWRSSCGPGSPPPSTAPAG